MSTKILALVDALGNLVSFTLLPGQRHDIVGVEALIKDKEFNALLADKTFDADWLLEELNERACQAVIPPTSKRKLQRAYDRHMCKWRHLVENVICEDYDFSWRKECIIMCLVKSNLYYLALKFVSKK